HIRLPGLALAAVPGRLRRTRKQPLVTAGLPSQTDPIPLPRVSPNVLDNSFSMLLNPAPGQPFRMPAKPMAQLRRQPFMRRAMRSLIAGLSASIFILACSVAARAQAQPQQGQGRWTKAAAFPDPEEELY